MPKIVDDPNRENMRPAYIHGSKVLTTAMAEFGIEMGAPSDALVFAPDQDPVSWEQIEEVLVDAFRLVRQALESGAKIIFILDGPALYGHRGVSNAVLATALMGGARSLAAEGVRSDVAVHVVTTDQGVDLTDVATTVGRLLRSSCVTGQVIHLDKLHIGRPAI